MYDREYALLLLKEVEHIASIKKKKEKTVVQYVLRI